MVLNKPLLQEQSVPNELIFIETGQSGSHSRWTTTPANSGFEIGPHAASGRWHWWGFFLQCGGRKCVITHAVKEIRFVLTLLVKKMMKCKEATWALISFYKAITIVLRSSDPHSVISNTSVGSGQPIRSVQCAAAIVHCPWQACKVYCTTKLCGNLGCALQWRKWHWNES